MNRGIIPLTIGALLLAAGISARSFVDYATDKNASLADEYQLPLTAASADEPLVSSNAYSGLQQTGMINTTFECFGTFGFGFARTSYFAPYGGFQTPPGSHDEYLFGGALWVGGIVGTDTLVSHGADGWSHTGNEFSPPNYPGGSVTVFDYITDGAIRAEFYDTITFGVDQDYSGRPHIPMNLGVTNRSLAWTTSPYNNIVFYDIVITNIGTQTIEKFCAGLYFDADVGFVPTLEYHIDDLAGSIPAEKIAYIIDNNGDLTSTEEYAVRKIFAAKLLACSKEVSSTNFNWWVSNSDPSYDFGPRLRGNVEDPFFDFGTGGLGTPEGDVNKYYILSHPEWDYDQVYMASIQPSDPLWLYPPQDIANSVTDGYDTKFLLSIASGDLMPDSSIRLIFAFFTADSVHSDPDNYANLPNNPDQYLANLNFDGVLENAAIADSLVASLIDPSNPVIGLQMIHQAADSVVVRWDRWAFDGIEGYDVYFSEVPTEALPYPGVAAPWLQPEELNKVASLGITDRYTFNGLQDDRLYFANVTHRTPMAVGDAGSTLILGPVIKNGPSLVAEYTYYAETESPIISWQDVGVADIDHYNIYRFETVWEYKYKYLPYYDNGQTLLYRTPVDTFEVDGTIYYYYAMSPYSVIDSGVTTFTDNSPYDGAYYVVTSVDKAGFESFFSGPTQTFATPPRTRDVLLVANAGSYVALTRPDTVINFYSDILAGLDYDIYSVLDTAYYYGVPVGDSLAPDWHKFLPYKLVILDIYTWEGLISASYEDRFFGFTKYILSGGKFAYMGALERANGFSPDPAKTPPMYYYQSHWFINRFFGIDSLYYCSPNYYVLYPPDPFEDSLFGFIAAEPDVSGFHPLAYDTTRYPFNSLWTDLWPTNTAIGVAAFKPNDKGEVTHRFKARYPEPSVLDNEVVGVHTVTDEAETYLFGFHLWYMEPTAARQLIDDILLGSPTSIENPDGALLPKSIALSQNYPNPFNPNTMISFELPSRATVTLEVFNILGQRVRTLVNAENLAAGNHLIEWDGTGDGGKTVSTGIYFYRLTTPETSISRKMMLIK